MESFKQRMARIRKRAGFTSQGHAAAAIECERGTVSMWEAPSSNVQQVSGDLLFRVAKAYQVRPEWINDLRSKDDGFPWSPSAAPAPVVSHVAGLDLGKIATARKFLEDLFDAEDLVFVPDDQSLLVANVYTELLRSSTPNWVELTTRYGRQIRGEKHERQRAIGVTGEADRGGDGEGAKEAKTKARRAR